MTGTGSWELPPPAVLIILPGRRIGFIDVSPDWMVRTEAPLILTALQAARAGKPGLGLHKIS